MSSPEVLDFEQLLGPISPDSPQGVDGREDATAGRLYNAVRFARQQAREAEKLAFQLSYLPPEDGVETPRVDWNAVVKPAIELLAQHSKDLWVATWLTEALGRLHGFTGLRDGFRLQREMCERFWGQLYPIPNASERETMEITFSQLEGLNNQVGQSPDPIDLIPLTEETMAWPPLTGLDYRDASRAGGSAAGTKPDGTPRPTLDAFHSVVRQGNRTFYANLRDDVAETLAEYRQLVAVIDTKCAEAGGGRFESLPSSAMVQRLTEAVDQVKQLTADLFPATSETADVPEGGLATKEVAVGESEVPRAASGAIRNREDAFRELGKVAEYFRRNEPHSPVSFALEQVIRWGRMSLPELMSELIPNQDARHDMFRLTGIVEDKSK